ncbi:hypothetical protein BHM03_00031984 [Ensete ventricosum]|nr:hypothetical protein BHM03_00031984 [Ensete ventricosum]
MNSCIARLLPAWLPPLITLKAGTGIMSSLVPGYACYEGIPFAPAPARQTLRETPRMALAPNFDLLGTNLTLTPTSLEHPLAAEYLHVAVPQLEGLVDPGGGAAGDIGAEDAAVGDEVEQGFL